VFARLSNATGTLDGVDVVGLFDDGFYQSAMGGAGLAASNPALSLPSADVPSDPVGLVFVKYSLDGASAEASYTVVATEPDGLGLTRLLLERVL
jgi:hypothetical protein